MKVLVNRFKKLVNKKNPAKYHKQAPATPPGYVNPFKHQQELEEKRQQQIRLQHQQAIERLKAQQELETLRRQQVKPVQPSPPALPTKPVEPPKAVQQVPKLPKKPSFFDKKVEITFKKPNIIVPKFKKPELNILKFTPPEPKMHNLEKPAAPVVHKPPVVESVKTEHKKPEIKKFVPKKLHKKHQLVFAGVIVGAALLGVLYFSGFAKVSGPTNETPQEEQATVNPAVKVAEAVSKKTTLPKGEEPVSATVTDRNKLQNQEFFSEAQNGDKILMYKQAKKAYLYRPSTDEVIAIAPLVYQDTAGASTSSAEAEEPTPTDDPNAPKTSIDPEPPHGKVLVPAKY